MKLQQLVANNIKRFRTLADLTQQELCDRLERQGESLNVKQLSQLENARHNITLTTLEKLAKGLGVSARDLMDDGSVSSEPTASVKEIAGVEAAIRLLAKYLPRG
jgi:transcriptional regulator with XRE-family HTH domain